MIRAILIFILLISSLHANNSLRTKLVMKYEEFKKESPCSSIISSGRRSKKKNKEVGGAKNSYHLRGMALDLVFPNCKKSLKEIGKIAQKYFNGVIVYKKHIHVDIRKRKYHAKH